MPATPGWDSSRVVIGASVGPRAIPIVAYVITFEGSSTSLRMVVVTLNTGDDTVTCDSYHAQVLHDCPGAHFGFTFH
jgi:hypothetical protein